MDPATSPPRLVTTSYDDDDGSSARTSSPSLSMASTPRSLADVPEEGTFSPPPDPSSPYANSHSSTLSTSTLGVPSRRTRKSSAGTGRRNGTASTEPGSPSASSSSHASRHTKSSSSLKTVAGRSAASSKKKEKDTPPVIRLSPELPQDPDMERVPTTAMYWSPAPVFGVLPTRDMRGHTVTLVDNLAWVFGGCDNHATSKDMYVLDVETMQWSRPATVGDIPNPSRAHTATLVDRKIIVYGGGQSSTYYDAVYVFDTDTRRWSKPNVTSAVPGEHPRPRRAHTAVYYQGRIWVFGGGDGMTALNDVWALDVQRMVWMRVDTHGKSPTPRGYHTANLVGNMMVVIGGSDGKDCFAEIWTLDLDTLYWQLVDLKVDGVKIKRPEDQKPYRRLSHSCTQVGSYLFIQGGHDGSDYSNQMYFFNLVNLQYETRLVKGKPPKPRGYHVSTLHDSRLFFFGGYDGQQAYDDVYILDLAASAYLAQVTSFQIEFTDSD